MKKSLLSIVALVLIAGGAAGLHITKKANAGDAKAAPSENTEKFNSSSEFVELSPLILPIIDANGLSQSIAIVVAIEVSSTSDAKKIENIAPKLQDAYIQDMYGELSAQSNLNAGGAIKVRSLKERLTTVSRNIAGEIVDDVLLQVVSQQPL